MRNVKGQVYNAYRAYKMLYYVILDAICLLLFLNFFDVPDIEHAIDLPRNFAAMSDEEKIEYIDSVSENILRKYFLTVQMTFFRIYVTLCVTHNTQKTIGHQH